MEEKAGGHQIALQPHLVVRLRFLFLAAFCRRGDWFESWGGAYSRISTKFCCAHLSWKLKTKKTCMFSYFQYKYLVWTGYHIQRARDWMREIRNRRPQWWSRVMPCFGNISKMGKENNNKKNQRFFPLSTHTWYDITGDRSTVPEIQPRTEGKAAEMSRTPNNNLETDSFIRTNSSRQTWSGK